MARVEGNRQRNTIKNFHYDFDTISRLHITANTRAATSHDYHGFSPAIQSIKNAISSSTALIYPNAFLQNQVLNYVFSSMNIFFTMLMSRVHEC